MAERSGPLLYRCRAPPLWTRYVALIVLAFNGRSRVDAIDLKRLPSRLVRWLWLG